MKEVNLLGITGTGMKKDIDFTPYLTQKMLFLDTSSDFYSVAKQMSTINPVLDSIKTISERDETKIHSTVMDELSQTETPIIFNNDKKFPEFEKREFPKEDFPKPITINPPKPLEIDTSKPLQIKIHDSPKVRTSSEVTYSVVKSDSIMPIMYNGNSRQSFGNSRYSLGSLEGRINLDSYKLFPVQSNNFTQYYRRF